MGFNHIILNQNGSSQSNSAGLTKRELIAAIALGNLLGNSKLDLADFPIPYLAETAVRAADCLIEALNQK